MAEEKGSDVKPDKVNETKKELQVLAWTWALMFAVGSLGSCMLAALTGAKWASLTGQERFLIIIAIVVNYSNTMGAFISKAVSRIREGKPFVNGDSTTHITKSQTSSNIADIQK